MVTIFSRITFLLVIVQFTFATSKTKVDPSQLSSARSAAASADYGILLAFVEGVNSDMTLYKSYMEAHGNKLPQSVADYIYYLAAIPSSIDLEANFASKFPFTEFQTFITNFPNYSSLLSKGSATTLYLPEYFITDSNVETNNLIASNKNNSSLSTVTSMGLSTSKSSSLNPTSSKSSSSSHNGGNKLQWTFPLSISTLFGLLL